MMTIKYQSDSLYYFVIGGSEKKRRLCVLWRISNFSNKNSNSGSLRGSVRFTFIYGFGWPITLLICLIINIYN
jgi:hypothetical protein